LGGFLAEFRFGFGNVGGFVGTTGNPSEALPIITKHRLEAGGIILGILAHFKCL
jgi:hypothetical protein